MALADGHRRELHPVGNVAHGRDAGAARPVVFIDRNLAAFAQRYPGALQPQPGGVRAAPGGDQHNVRRHRIMAFRRHRQTAIGMLFHPLDRAIEPIDDAARHGDLQQPVAQAFVIAAQDLVAAVDDCHPATQRIEDAGKFHGDIARALDHHPARQGGQIEHFVRGDAQVIARKEGHHRPGAGRDQHMPGRDVAPAGEAHRVGTGDDGAVMEMVDLVAVERRRVGLFQPVDIAGNEVAQLGPVEGHRAQRPAELRGVLQLVGKAGAIDQQLLGHAAPDHASPADAELLRHRHPRAVRCGNPAGAYPARAGADDEKIVVEVWHRHTFPVRTTAAIPNSPPPRSFGWFSPSSTGTSAKS